ncbi:Uncharacterized protein C19A8.11c [Colletotrichum chlorophyti]|uniref:Uncharacterized protein C19A8.11c n=1 Tax=Colletotrichum chlorophyti TaxID=708187 RepID=A0A1Q8RRE4_9PEZI|nr:Uncharacterized protein C19A8.11c [Colletotrichum chlorophyti]
MEVKNPRRVLAVSLADSTQHLSRVIKDLTGTTPEPASTSLAGTTHVLALKTSYYAADVPIWLDLVSSPAEWSASFLSEEAKEVLSVLGGLVVVFSLPTSESTTATTSTGSVATDAIASPSAPIANNTRALITEVGKVVREGLGGWGWDGVGLGVGIGEGEAEEWEELCAEWGLEFVQVQKMGIARVLEALESNDWDAADGAPPGIDSDSDDAESSLPRRRRPLADGDDDDFDLDPESLDFGFDRSDFEGLKKAIWGLEQDEEEGYEGRSDKKGPSARGEASPEKTEKEEKKEGPEAEEEDKSELDDGDVEKIEGMMRKLQAVRDLSEGLPEEQRRRMAKKAVAEVMKEL